MKIHIARGVIMLIIFFALKLQGAPDYFASAAAIIVSLMFFPFKPVQ